MPFTPSTAAELRQLLSVAYAARANTPALDIEGEPLDALWNAVKMALLKIQDLISYEDSISRLATIAPNSDGSPSPDAISFIKPWGIAPIAGAASSGPVVYSIPSPSAASITIKAGTLVQTGPGAPQLRFIQATDVAIPAGQLTSPQTTVQCLVSGVATCIQAGAITQIVSGPGTAAPPSGVSVTNPAAFGNGTDIESQDSLLARFSKAVTTGTVGTNFAIAARLLSLYPDLTYSLGDRIDPDGTEHDSFFCIIAAKQGATAPTDSSLLANIKVQILGDPTNGVMPVRSVGIDFDVFSPTIVPVSMGATVYVTTGYAWTDVQAAIATAWQAYIASLGLSPTGASVTLAYLRIAALIYGVPGVAQVDNLLLNGGTSDIIAPFANLFAAGAATLTQGT